MPCLEVCRSCDACRISESEALVVAHNPQANSNSSIGVEKPVDKERRATHGA